MVADSYDALHLATYHKAPKSTGFFLFSTSFVIRKRLHSTLDVSFQIPLRFNVYL